MLKKLCLKKQEHRRIENGHLWIFSNEIDVLKSPLSSFQAGELVAVENAQGNPLGIGYINPHTLLCARILSRKPDECIDTAFFIQRIKTALTLRERLYTQPFYRLVFAESDLLPGLIIDRYKDIFVVQITTAGMELLKASILAAINELFKPRAILLRNDNPARVTEGLNQTNESLEGEIPESITVIENKVEFAIALLNSQKTGWYFDQALNRSRLQSYVKNCRVLDVYSYIGAFGIQAAVHGAKQVVCIDSSVSALKALERNAEINNVSNQIHSVTDDAFEAMKKLIQEKEKFDVVSVDPPAFIKKRKDIPQGSKAYTRINELAIQLLNKEGILITSSCSMHMQRDMFVDVLRKASIKQNVLLQIIEHGYQAPDHPIHPAIPETEYLKTLFCRVVK